MFVHPTQKVLSSATLSNEIFCGSFFLVKIFVIFVHATVVEQISFLNHKNGKVVGGKHNVLVHYADFSAPNQFGVVLCNPFR